jgi:uncharacterized membrane protein YccC
MTAGAAYRDSHADDHGAAVPLWFRVVVPLEALSFFIGALLHAEVNIAGLHEPRIIPATVVESLCGIVLAIASFAALGNERWWRKAAVTSHVVALAGVALGMVALAAGRGPRTASNDVYHYTMVVLLAFGLLLLWRGRKRTNDEEKG